MSVQTYQRLTGIQTTIERTGKITNTDLQWSLALLHSQPVVESADNEDSLHRAVFLYLSGLKPLPKQEENELFAAVLPYASDKNPTVRGMAAATLAETDGRRALPDLQKMLSDPDPQVQQNAARSIKNIQKATSQPSHLL